MHGVIRMAMHGWTPMMKMPKPIWWELCKNALHWDTAKSYWRMFSSRTYGIVDRVTYGAQEDTPETRTAAVNAFLKQVKDAVSGTDVKISIVLPATILETKQDGVAGWDLSAIAQSVDRIYMNVEDQAVVDATRTAVAALRDGADAEEFFAALTKTPLDGGSYVLIK